MKALPLLLLLAVRAPAQPNMTDGSGPNSRAPKNGRCGLYGQWTEDGIQGYLRQIFQETWQISGIKKAEPKLTFKPYDVSKLASTRHVNDDINNPDTELVIYMTICDVAHGESEIAAVIGHELGHYELAHGPTLEKRRDQEWIPACAGDTACVVKKINEAQMPQESEADAKSVEYLKKSNGRFKPEGMVQVLGHMKDLKWARGDGAKQNPNHPPLTQRAIQIVELLEPAKKDK